MDNKAAATKLATGLCHKTDAVHDEVELRDNIFRPEVIGQVVNIVICQSRLATTLSVPDNTFPGAVFDSLLDSLGSKDLRITHDVLFITCIGVVNVCDAKL